MNFQRIGLENFRPYPDADVDLDPGVTVVHGPNGAGKTSLLEAAFFALYGARALDDAVLADVVTEGAEEAVVELDFVHDGADHRLRRRVRTTGERARTAECVLETPDGPVEGATAVRDWVSSMLRMDADAFVNCAYVRQGEVNQLIQATPADRQSIIDDLLQLGRLERYRDRADEARLGVNDVLTGRQELLEDLAGQIERLEEKDLPAALAELREKRAEVDSEVDRLEDQRESAETTREEAAEILEEQEQRREELAEVEADVEDLQSEIDETEREREELAERRREHRERRERLVERRAELLDEASIDVAFPDPDDSEGAADASTTGDADADGSPAPVDRVRATLDDLQEEDEQLRDRIEEVRIERADRADEAERRRERAEELVADAERRRQEADDLAETVADRREDLEERREDLADVEERIDDLRGEFEDAPVDRGEADPRLADLRERREEIRASIGDLQADLQARRDRIAEAERLLEAGNCPECGQPVEDSPHVDRLNEDRAAVEAMESELSDLQSDLETVEDRIDRTESLVETERELSSAEDDRETLRELIADREQSIEDDRERVERLREAAADLEDEAEDHRAAAEAAEEDAERLREEVADLNERRATCEERIDRLERVLELTDEVASIGDEIAAIDRERADLGELNDERRARLGEKQARREELREAVDEETIAEAREEKRRAESYIERVDGELADLRERREDLGERIGGVQADLDRLEELRERHESVADRVEALETLYEQTERLGDTYGDLRAELRQRNVETLERMLNETFRLVYENDSYARIELDGDYRLTVYQKDGTPLDPDQLSGGERALFNLSLRCAIYRLLAEGIDGAAPLPPLILDEPTVFLDSGHVSRLVDLIGEMRDLGVEQIVVVTHDEELVGAADATVRVSKDPTTNRSTVELADPGRESSGLPTP